MQPLAVLNVVGLNRDLLAHAPAMTRFAESGVVRSLRPVLPAVTCSVQTSMLTGVPVEEHGIVGNGWYDRDEAEVRFWRQSNHLVEAEKVWETARRRDPTFTCANHFWWFNMYSSVDVSVTPRPRYKADGRKIPDVYTHPPELRDRLQRAHGPFPLFRFWGPAAGIESSAWIARAAMDTWESSPTTLTLIYLPHLDYDLQRYGPDDPRIPAAVRAIDEVVAELAMFFRQHGVQLMILSEYGIEAVDVPVALNRVLREAGMIQVREEDGGELLDAGASDAFAAVDHQVAHVYVQDPARVREVASLLAGVDGVAEVMDDAARRREGICHPRAGELTVVASAGRWFSYPWWLDDDRAPDFARCVDIHRKPGYDPAELFIDPELSLPKARIAWKVLRKKLGFRMLMDVIPLDASLVRGSHGRVDQPAGTRPIIIAPEATAAFGDHDRALPCEAVRDVMLELVFGGEENG